MHTWLINKALLLIKLIYDNNYYTLHNFIILQDKSYRNNLMQAIKYSSMSLFNIINHNII